MKRAVNCSDEQEAVVGVLLLQISLGALVKYIQHHAG